MISMWFSFLRINSPSLISLIKTNIYFKGIYTASLVSVEYCMQAKLNNLKLFSNVYKSQIYYQETNNVAFIEAELKN